MMAVNKKNVDIVRMLLHRGADNRPSHGSTPLRSAFDAAHSPHATKKNRALAAQCVDMIARSICVKPATVLLGVLRKMHMDVGRDVRRMIGDVFRDLFVWRMHTDKTFAYSGGIHSEEAPSARKQLRTSNSE